LTAFSEEAEKGISDLGNLDKINEATLLFNLKSRYYKDPMEIHTYCLSSLLLVNPFKEVPHLMREEVFNFYQSVILL